MWLLTISLIIPCYYKHASYLEPLLEEYAKQTVLVDEVVISLSESTKVEEGIIDALKSHAWPFALEIMTVEEHQFAGENRRRAAKQAKGDLIICQDADDLPHPQRVEIIQYFYNQYHFTHLLHGWTREVFPLYNNLGKIAYFWPPSLRWIKRVNVHHGNSAFDRKVLEKVEWSSYFFGEDQEFTANVYQQFEKNIVVGVPLVIYRAEQGSMREAFYRAIERGQTIRQDIINQFNPQDAEEKAFWDDILRLIK